MSEVSELVKCLYYRLLPYDYSQTLFDDQGLLKHSALLLLTIIHRKVADEFVLKYSINPKPDLSIPGPIVKLGGVDGP